jgi:rSAM/selenodomain-associated transferase 2
VVDGGSEDDTRRLARPHCHQLLRCAAGRSRQLNTGAAAARGRYLLFLHADTTPLFDGAQLAAVLADGPGWGFCPVRLSGPGPALRLVERSMNLRSRLTGIGTGDQLQFVQRELFTRSGGFADLPLMEDVELSRRLRRQWRPRILPWPVRTSSRRWEENGVLDTVLLMWRLRLAFALGADPQALWRRYYGDA